MSIHWAPPKKTNGVVTRYKIEIDGDTIYKNEFGRMITNRFKLFKDHIDSSHLSFVKNQIPPNTNYTVIKNYNVL